MNDQENTEGAPRRMGRRAEWDLVEGCVQALRDLIPDVKEWRNELMHRRLDPGPDAHLRLNLDGRWLEYAIEAKRWLTKAHVNPLFHQARHMEEQGKRLLVCANRIPETLGAELRQHQIAYVDLGGNAYLRGDGVYVLVTGRPAVRRKHGRKALTGTEVRLLGVFLRDHDAGNTKLAELAEQAGIAIGGVRRACEKLVQFGILDQTKGRHWVVRDRREGLRRFGEGWGAVVRHKLLPLNYRLLQTKGHGDLEHRLAGAGAELGCLLGGERAAAHLTHYLITDHATLHVQPGQQGEVAKALTMVPDEDGPVTMLERYGRGDEHRPAKPHPVPLAHPLLVWAECLTVPDERVAQAAARLYDDVLKPEHD